MPGTSDKLLNRSRYCTLVVAGRHTHTHTNDITASKSRAACPFVFSKQSTDPYTPTTLRWADGLARRLYRTAEADTQQWVSKVLAGPAKTVRPASGDAGSSPISSADETMSLCPLPSSLVQPRPSPPACCDTDLGVLWSGGKCGHAFYERPCDDKTHRILPGCGADLLAVLCLIHPRWRPRVGLGLEGRTGTAKGVLLLLKLDYVSFAWGKEVLGGMLGQPSIQALKGAKIRLGVLEWSR